mgnify:CR=1 FL=1
MFPVLLFLRLVIWNSSRDDRTIEITFRRWELPPTRRTSPIQLCSETAFAVVFYITYWYSFQKGSPHYLFLIKKMGVYQKAVKAFLDLTCDDAMMDRWIPDEDWVRQIWDIGKDNRSSITNLNTGLAKKCMVSSMSSSASSSKNKRQTLTWQSLRRHKAD